MSYIHSYGKSVRRYHSGTSDGLLYAGQEGVQLTWMDAKVGNWVVTPRIGKPIEVNALWYNAFRPMEVIAWSENLTPERAQAQGARLVSKDELFQHADILTIHLVLSRRTRGLGRCGRACGHEALGAAREHVAWTDRPGGGAHRGTRSTQNCRRRHRRIRRRTITIGPSVSLIGECSRHPAYRLRLPRTL
jgi:Amylo-alpha-1,6-glucosidase/D-isomer specific 2-hydroxyacid dehydrogenase, NAD binding domain